MVLQPIPKSFFDSYVNYLRNFPAPQIVLESPPDSSFESYHNIATKSRMSLEDDPALMVASMAATSYSEKDSTTFDIGPVLADEAPGPAPHSSLQSIHVTYDFSDR